MINKKIFLLLIAFIMCLGVSAFIFSGFSLSDNCNVGDAFFEMPKNYQLDSNSINHTDDYVSLNITNGNNIISIVEYKDNKIDDYIQNYQNRKSIENHSVETSTLKLGNDVVKKSVDTVDSNNVHYWVIKYNKVYEIYTWTADSNFDNVVKLIIGSLSTSFI